MRRALQLLPATLPPSWILDPGSGSGATAPDVETPPPLLLTYMLCRPVAKVPKSGPGYQNCEFSE